MQKTLRFAFKLSLPILFGYVFLGIAFGILMNEAGYGPLWSFFAAVFIYAGSMQFVMVPLLMAGTPLITVAVMTLFINSRHIFYGLGFIDRFRRMGWRYPYMVLSLTDETYSVLCSASCPEDVNEDNALFALSLLNHCYWILGCVLGTLLGGLIPIDFTGIDFSMTALFVVIFINQWKQYRSHIPALTGLACGVLSLLIFGADRFLLPALSVTVLILAAMKPRLEHKEEASGTCP